MIRPMTTDDQLRRQCRHRLSGHAPESVRAALIRLAAHPAAQAPADVYGAGGAIALLEARVADLLGGGALASFKGSIVQMSALKAHAERMGGTRVALSPWSHMIRDEMDALEHVGALSPVVLGTDAGFTADDLDRAGGALAAVVLELPLRRAGYVLPAWDTLEDIAAWCRGHGVPLHIDGARLWEAAAGYGVAPRRIADLGDSVYVSFYKGLGGMAGAALCADAETIALARTWHTRLGGTVHTGYPFALDALDGLDRNLARIPGWTAKARALAAGLAGIGSIRRHPEHPHANAFQLWFPADVEAVTACNRAFARRHDIWLFSTIAPTPLAGWTAAEVVIGSASDAWSVDQARDWIAAFRADLDVAISSTIAAASPARIESSAAMPVGTGT